uniref:Uncharacterized protein n=1 Tax=Lactuca sativa TaxID=4236 RepID=A0A9R1X9T3_LACSA|nr:hypothetical protein LSAT_V11C500295300 [Lactuca sativa]
MKKTIRSPPGKMKTRGKIGSEGGLIGGWFSLGCLGLPAVFLLCIFFFFFLGFFDSSLFSQQVPLLSSLILLLHLFGYTTNECKTEIHDLSDDTDYAAASKQCSGSEVKGYWLHGSSSMTRSDSSKRSSSSDPEDAQIVYLKDNVTIHPTQYAKERITGHLKLIKQVFYNSCSFTLSSSAIAGVRQALITGIPKKGESQENEFKDAASVCLPVINAAIKDVENGTFPKSSSLHIIVPSSPLQKQGLLYKTKTVTFHIFRSLWRSKPVWLAIVANRNPSAARFMSNQPGMGLQLAQLGRGASAAGAARRLNSQKKSLEVFESVGVSGKADPNKTFQDSPQEETDENLDFRALLSGFILDYKIYGITPKFVSHMIEADIEKVASEWITDALQTNN